MENKMFSLETLKFKPENVPLTPDFQKGENIEPNEG